MIISLNIRSENNYYKIFEAVKTTFTKLNSNIEKPDYSIFSLRSKFSGQHLWVRGYFCATVGTVTEETIKRYMESQELSDKDDIFKIEQ